MAHTGIIKNTTAIQTRFFIRLLIYPFLFVTKVLPLPVLRAASVPFMGFFFLFYPKWRRIASSNLQHVLGKKASRKNILKTTWKIYKSYGRYIVDLYHLTDVDPHETIKLITHASGYEHLKEALDRGKGGILLTLHMGNWELGGVILSKLGHTVNVVYFPDTSTLLEEERKVFRATKGINQIALDNTNLSTIKMLRALQRNELVALQGDKLFFDKGMEVPFFGAPAKFPRGPVILAMAADAPILPSFILFDKGKDYHTIIDKPIYMKKTANREKDIAANLKRVVEVLEGHIKKHRDQWYCFDHFWENSVGAK